MSPEKKLFALFSRLSPRRRESLLEYAEFLAGRESGENVPDLEVVPVPRPERETVIGAIKRLSATYPMLDGRALLNETSLLLSEHLLQGVPADEVIDRVEALFERHYREHLEPKIPSGK